MKRIMKIKTDFKLRQSKDLGSNPSAVESVIFSTERFSNSLNIKTDIDNFMKLIELHC